jgi:hypothetical protein
MMMDRRQLESAGANYPYMHVQGLYGLPFGLIWFLIGLSNLEKEPVPLWILGCCGLLALAALAAVTVYYQHNFGRVTPITRRQVRYAGAAVVGFAVYVGADQLGRAILGRPPQHPVSTVVAAWALGMLVFYAATEGLKAHHVIIWGSLLVAGLLPIWGLGVDRDALASFPIGAATILSGLFDHCLLVHTFRSYEGLNLEENSDAGA